MYIPRIANHARAKRITIKFDKEAFWKSWSAAIVMFVTVWLVEQIHFTRYLLPIYILVGGVTYAGALRILKAVNKNDLQLIRNLAGKHAAPLVDVLEKSSHLIIDGGLEGFERAIGICAGAWS